MLKLLILIAFVVVITIWVMRLRAALPWNQAVKRAGRRGLLQQGVEHTTQDEVMNLLMRGSKWAAIRLLRRHLGLSYRDAKLLVEAIEGGHRPTRVVPGEATEV